MCSRLKTHPDIIANVEFDKKLYDIYEKYKLEKTQRFLEEKKEENEPKTENTTTAQTHVKIRPLMDGNSKYNRKTDGKEC